MKLWAPPSRSTCYTMEWYRRERIKAEVAFAFQRALRTGELVRRTHCERCGEAPRGKRPVVGHHSDYSQPLAVVWLCQACHAREHVAIRAGVAADPYRKCGPISANDLLAALRHTLWHLAREDQYAVRLRGKLAA